MRRRYPDEFRQQILALVKAGCSSRAFAPEFEASEHAIRNLVKPAAVDALQLGAGPVETITAVLDAARAVADDIARASEAQQEVERLLSATQSHRLATKG